MIFMSPTSFYERQLSSFSEETQNNIGRASIVTLANIIFLEMVKKVERGITNRTYSSPVFREDCDLPLVSDYPICILRDTFGSYDFYALVTILFFAGLGLQCALMRLAEGMCYEQSIEGRYKNFNILRERRTTSSQGNN